jgi:hypothetical protein
VSQARRLASPTTNWYLSSEPAIAQLDRASVFGSNPPGGEGGVICVLESVPGCVIHSCIHEALT